MQVTTASRCFSICAGIAVEANYLQYLNPHSLQNTVNGQLPTHNFEVSKLVDDNK